MRTPTLILRLLPLGIGLALAACQASRVAPTEEADDAAPEPPPVMEVRYVEASGPPPQDPARRAEPRVEDPEQPSVQLEELRRELGREQQRRIESEKVAAQLRGRVRELEARVLSLSLERARLEQEVLQLRIDALRAELEALGGPIPTETETPRESEGPPRPGQGR